MAVYKRFAQAALPSGTSVSATFSESTPLDSSHTLVAVLFARTTSGNVSNNWGATALAGSGNNGSLIFLAAYAVRGDGVRNGVTFTFGSELSAAAVSLYGIAGHVSLTPDVSQGGNFASSTSASLTTAATTTATKTISIAAVALSGTAGGFSPFTDGYETPAQDSLFNQSGIKAYTTAGQTSAPSVAWNTARSGRMGIWTLQGSEAAAPTRQGDLFAGTVLPTYYVGNSRVSVYQGTNQLTSAS